MANYTRERIEDIVSSLFDPRTNSQKQDLQALLLNRIEILKEKYADNYKILKFLEHFEEAVEFSY